MADTEEIYDVIVVGGGASGLMAAGRAAEVLAAQASDAGQSSGARDNGRVLLLEKNKKMGEKLKITGGGRCNITNAEYDTRVLLKNYGEAGEFLFSTFSQFGVKNTFTFFESRGLPLVIEDRKRVFPKSQKALDVYRVLEKYVQRGNVTIKIGSPVTKVVLDNSAQANGVQTKDKHMQISGKRISSVICGNQEYFAKSFIFATGGASHRETGSTGDGFGWLRELGHTVTKPTPSVVPLAVAEEWAKNLAGISIPSMKITFFVDGVKKLSKKGRILFTHFGVSGPLILNSAQEVADLLRSGIVTANIDMFPDLDLGALPRKMIDLFDKNKNKMLKNVLADILPAGTAKGISLLIVGMTNDSKADIGQAILDKKAHSITVLDRNKLVHLFKNLPLTITGLMGNDRAVISDGGVALTEIDTRTMKSKIVDNLFVTGDLLHINRPSGGYSLQLCWTTGYVAGSAAAYLLMVQ